MACVDVARPGAGVATHARPGSARSRVELRLQCVSSGYMSGGSSCPRTIAAGAVLAAWALELEKTAGDRFFHFTWGGGEWLAYGLEDGLVRGVYCPDHSAERDERSFSYGSREPATRQLAPSG
ncbi:MAG TPA: hypothetical protein VNZ01_01935 [Solirubrobacteraceae bacterium]|jgi:hypothetical protein|nr:hypothetical protein [Solirubrobacteraceae bacterium]